MIVANLLEQKLIQSGTWVGVRQAHVNICYTWRVHDCVVHEDTLICWNPQNNQLHVVHLQDIQEVDGMTLKRFCEQADLDVTGVKKPPRTRRGRKPKNRAHK